MIERIERPSMTRIAWTPLMSAPWENATAAATRFAGAPRPLPTMFRTPMVAHALSSRVPASARLRSLVAALRGRLAIVNPPRPTRLPAGLVAAVRGLVRVGCDGTTFGATEGWDWDPIGLHAPDAERERPRRSFDARSASERRMANALLSTVPPAARDQLTGGATWIALALYESATPILRLDRSVSRDKGTVSPAAIATVTIEYQLVIAAGTSTPPDWESLDATARAEPAVAWPLRRRSKRASRQKPRSDSRPAWFVAGLIVPDAWFVDHTDAETLAQWVRLTGRADAPDRYWFPETWDRFLEPGRQVGWLTANDVWRPRRGRLASAGSAGDDGETDPDDPTAPRRPPFTLTPDLERGVGVPPGYALVQCVGGLSVAVVVHH